MGTVTSLEGHRLARRSRGASGRVAPPRATLFFDLASPYTYLAAERADRLFARLEWVPASADALHAAELTEQGMRDVRERALLLGLPFVWPEERPPAVRGAMRVASLAAERGCGAAFVLAASRLAFCGGFDVDDPEILAEAAAAAGIGLGETLAAAGDVGRDGPIEEAGRMLLAAGASRLPALRVGRTLFCGEDRLHEAAAARAAG
ncbi:MAG: DsbA family protein [Actinobacteria bacterium]|nr:DsbA family protein [Actinomycetota bacterium]